MTSYPRDFSLNISRRSILLSTMGGLFLLAQNGHGVAQAQRRGGPEFFIAPSGSGSGRSWADAAPIDRLPSLVRQVGPGGRINIRADEGDIYDLSVKPLKLDQGGTKEAPVVIRGSRSDGKDGYAQLHSDRTEWRLPESPETVTDTSGWNHGGDLFVLKFGTNHIIFEHLDLQRAGNAIHVADAMSGLTIRNCKGYNVRRFLEINGKIEVSDVVVSNVAVIGFSKHCFRCRGTGQNWLFEGISANSGRQDKDNFAVGLGINEQAHGIIVRNSQFSNCHDSSNKYWNGDGISSEEENSDVLIENVVSHGHTDGGIDLKSSKTVVRNCEFYDNKINIRAWGDITLVNVVTRSAHIRGGVGYAAHIGVYANKEVKADLRIDGIRMQEQDPDVSLFSLGGEDTEITLTNYQIDKAPGTSMVRKDQASGARIMATPPLP
jgi:hypothetical protein